MAKEPNQGKRKPDDHHDLEKTEHVHPGEQEFLDIEETLLLPAEPPEPELISDEAIDLGVAEIGPEVSGASAINWGSLADAPKSSSGPGSGIQFDSPSDTDLLRHAQEPQPIGGVDDDEGAIDLLAKPAPLPEEILPPRKPAPLRNPTTLRPFAAHTVLGASEPPAELPVDDGSGVDLKALSLEAEQFVVPELRGAPAEGRPPGDSGIDLVEEKLLAEGGSGVIQDLGAAPSGTLKSPSGRDLIAEAVESGIDLAEADMELVEDEPTPTPSTIGEHVDLDARGAEDFVSSAVNLGGPGAREHGEEEEPRPLSSGNIDAMIDFEMTAAPGGSRSGTAASAVDLGGHPGELKSPSASSSLRETGEVVADSDEKFSGMAPESGRNLRTINANPDSMVRVAGELPSQEELDLATLAAAADAEALADAEEAEQKLQKKGKSASKKDKNADGDDDAVIAAPRKGRGGAWFGGTVLGTLVGAGACIGLTFVDINVPDMARNAILEATGQPLPKKTTQTNPGTDNAVQPNATATAADYLRRGEFDKAAQAGIDKGDESKPEAVGARGEYRWLSYLRKQRAAKAKLNANDEDVAKAMEDLKKADTPDAAFWLGNVQEATGDLDAARKTYGAAAIKFKDDGAQLRRFQSALNRLDLRAEKPANPAGMSRGRPWRAEEALVVALLLTTLQDEPKDEEKGKKKEDEKGKKKTTAPKDKDDDEKGKKKADAPKDKDDDEKAKKKAAMPNDKGEEKGKVDDQPRENPPTQSNDTDEAGAEFWQAAKLARDRKFAEAIQTLDKARTIHDSRRFTRLRKPQNPLTDPTEEIFLRACDELKIYWEMKERLSKGGYLAENQDPAKAVDGLLTKVKEASEGNKALAEKLIADKVIEKPEDLADGVDDLLKARKASLDIGKKLVDEKVAEKPEDLGKGVDSLLATRKAADALADKLVKAKIIDKPEEADKGVEALLARKKIDDEIADKLVKEKILDTPDLGKGVDKLVADRKDAALKIAELTRVVSSANAVFKQVADDLTAAKFNDPKGDVAQGVRNALRMATVVDPQGLIRGLQTDLGNARRVLGVSRTPKDMLSVWLPQLTIGADVAGPAGIDAGRVLQDPSSTPAQTLHAECLQALIDWSRENWDVARPKLEKCLTLLPASDSAWRSKVESALKIAADPGTYYLDGAKNAEAKGKIEVALGNVNAALDRLPEKDRPAAVLYQAQLHLDRARAKGKLKVGDADLGDARKNLQSAAKAGLPRAHYLLGQIAEELGQMNEAEAAYRAAVRATPTVEGAGSTYRVALARVLLRERQANSETTPPLPVGPAPKEVKPEPKEAPKPAEKPEIKKTTRAPKLEHDALETLILMTVLGFQFPLQDPDPAQLEALKLADEILAAPADRVPFEARAKALAIKGLWSRALQTYVEGLRPLLKREHAEGLLELVRNHPTLKRPDTLATPNGMEGEKYYATGLRHYFSRRYAAAERDLTSAIEQDNQDARFFYFLGLARLAQNKRDAFEDFEQAAKLEQQNRPGRTAVSQALERVQGRARRVVNEVRETTR